VCVCERDSFRERVRETGMFSLNDEHAPVNTVPTQQHNMYNMILYHIQPVPRGRVLMKYRDGYWTLQCIHQ